MTTRAVAHRALPCALVLLLAACGSDSLNPRHAGPQVPTTTTRQGVSVSRAEVFTSLRQLTGASSAIVLGTARAQRRERVSGVWFLVTRFTIQKRITWPANSTGTTNILVRQTDFTDTGEMDDASWAGSSQDDASWAGSSQDESSYAATFTQPGLPATIRLTTVDGHASISAQE